MVLTLRKTAVNMSEEDKEKAGTNHPTTFYGINLRLAEGLKRPEGVPLYCTTIQEVQSVVRANKTARFKSFSSREEAETFSGLPTEPLEATSPLPGPALTGAAGEKPSPFKNPSRHDFQSFRQLVESGDERAVTAAVARNPRYLVNSGDTPALLREGPRQNSLHLAALHGRDAVCRTLLALVADPELFRRLYPDDAPEVAATRAEYMLDLYLNMPTKGTFETPLHLAAKMGHVEVVRALVQNPACKRDLTNKFGETPEQITCQQCRAADPAPLRRQISFLLQEPFYVQVLAEADGSGAPVLTPPCSPQQQHRQRGHSNTPQSPVQSPGVDSPLDSPLRPRAWAGPMPRQLADEFHRRWRSPLSVSPLRNRKSSSADDVRLTDAGKGWERVGRELASEMAVEWREYWPFLDRHLDLTSDEGLQALETHLHKQNCRLMDTTANLEEVARRLEPPSPSAAPPPRRPSPRSPPPLSPVSALCHDLHELRLDDRSLEEEAAELAPPISLPAATVAPRRGRLRELVRGRQCSEPLPRELDSDGSDTEEFYTPPSSVESGSPATPGQAPEVFIHGRQPTTADLDALRALESVTVDPARYPSVCNWRSQVLARSRTQGFRFATPRRPTCRPPAVPERDGSPLTRPPSSRLFRHGRGVNGHL